jgi:hypothetical protein
MHQEALPIGFVLRAASVVPLRAVGEYEGQPPWFLRIPSDADHRSEVMAIAIPN